MLPPLLGSRVGICYSHIQDTFTLPLHVAPSAVNLLHLHKEFSSSHHGDLGPQQFISIMVLDHCILLPAFLLLIFIIYSLPLEIKFHRTWHFAVCFFTDFIPSLENALVHNKPSVSALEWIGFKTVGSTSFMFYTDQMLVLRM